MTSKRSCKLFNSTCLAISICALLALTGALSLYSQANQAEQKQEAEISNLIAKGGGLYYETSGSQHPAAPHERIYAYPGTLSAQTVHDLATALSSKTQLPILLFEIKYMSYDPGLCYYYFILSSRR